MSIVTRSLTLLLALAPLGCSSLFHRDEPVQEPENAGPNPQQLLQERDQRIRELETSNQTLHTKINDLETKLRAAETRPDLRQKSDTRHSTGTIAGAEVLTSLSESDPERGLVVDGHVQAFRQAKVLFDSQKYPEAILGFSSFIERVPNHSLAGLAQFYLADSYLLQGEFALAEQEYYQVIGKYPTSPRVSSAYQRLGLTLRKQGKLREAEAAESQVQALFPNSPAAREIAQQQNTTAANAGLQSAPTTVGAPVAPAPTPPENPTVDVPTAPSAGIDTVPGAAEGT